MTPKQEAEKLLEEYKMLSPGNFAKCAEVAVDKILDVLTTQLRAGFNTTYWKEVKSIIHNKNQAQ